MTWLERASNIALAANDIANSAIGDIERKVAFYRREYFYKNDGDFERFIAMIFKINSYNTLGGGLL